MIVPAPTKTAESVWSRQLHLIAVNGALLALVSFPAAHEDYRRRTWAWIPGVY